MTDTQVRHITFSQAVMLRPKMYTLEGTLPEIIAFLEGYYSGIAKGDPYAAPVVEWEAFRQWIANKLCVDASQAFAAFMQRHRTNPTSSALLAEWFTTFLHAQSQ